MPITVQPLIFAIWPTIDPTEPAAADTTTVSPDCGFPQPSRPKYAVQPATTHTLNRCVIGSMRGTLVASFAGSAAKSCQPVSANTRSPAAKPGAFDETTSEMLPPAITVLASTAER